MTAAATADRGTPASAAKPLAGVYEADKWFGGVHAVKSATLELLGGQVHCLVGENGAGKSTIVKLLSGVHRPDGGRVVVGVNGSTISSPADALEAGVSTVFQEMALVPEMTVAENIWLGRNVKRFGMWIDRRSRSHLTTRLLEDLGVEGIRATDKVKDLGVARKQLVEIARVVSREDERVVIMDEPTAALSGTEVEALFQLIRRLRDRGLAILYITHRLEEVELIGDVVTVMRDAEIRSTWRTDEVDRHKIIEEMVGRRIEDLYPREGRSEGGVVLEITTDGGGGSGGLQARRGQVTGLFGLVGAGRSELVRSALGADPRPHGLDLRLEGRERRFRSPGDALRAGIALIPEDRKAEGLVPDMSVASNIAMSSFSQLATSRVFLPPRRFNHAAAPLVKQLNIRTPTVDQRISALSGGNQQKALIGRAIAADPLVVVFDEPTRGVDVGAKVEVYGLINQLCRQGRAVLMISSDLPEALGLSDVLYVMHGGRVAGQIDPRDSGQREAMELALGHPES
jgi:ribose transport system ATP-binding protein